MSTVLDVLDAFDLVVDKATLVLPESLTAGAAAVGAAARLGRGHLGGTLIVALAGGTGTGKSSLLNALAGEEVASVSPLRPHTEDPLAWVDEGAEPALHQTLNRLGVGDRHGQDRIRGLAIVDLPDQDSIELGHRATVERLLPEVDVVAWVADPEKYRDGRLHADYLRPLSRYHQEQFIFVLNQIDRLGDDVERVLADFTEALRSDGVRDPRVFPVAADPPSGAPQGIGELEAFLRDRLDAKRVATTKMLGDLREAAGEVAGMAGVAGGAGIGFVSRWAEVKATATAELTGSPDPAGDALSRLGDFVTAISVEAGGAPGRAIRAALLPGAVEDAMRLAAAAVPDAAAVQAALDSGIGQPLEALLRDRAVLAAAIAGLAVTIAQLEAKLVA